MGPARPMSRARIGVGPEPQRASSEAIARGPSKTAPNRSDALSHHRSSRRVYSRTDPCWSMHVAPGSPDVGLRPDGLTRPTFTRYIIRSASERLNLHGSHTVGKLSQCHGNGTECPGGGGLFPHLAIITKNKELPQKFRMTIRDANGMPGGSRSEGEARQRRRTQATTRWPSSWLLQPPRMKQNGQPNRSWRTRRPAP